ncbi:polyribonucleotide nucleotidyltransferase 2 mitochondrial-like, partial [Trifolium medium]|nr:polyribonucleotide nucleotidyltransferase 2 mitochondrial-like [Trifolium medium]
KSDTQRAEENKKEGKGNAPSSAKDVKLGTKVNAKVYQIREHGLVLDLGGIRGMYRFEENGKKDFKIGDEMQTDPMDVCCEDDGLEEILPAV